MTVRSVGALPPGAGRERSGLVFRLDPVASTAGNEDAEPKFRAVVRRSLAEAGIRTTDRFWAEVELDDAGTVGRLVERLERLLSDGVARPASGHVGVWLEDCEEAPLEWFELDPKRTFPLRRAAPYKEVSARELPPGCHVAAGGVHYVSESFRSIVAQEGFRGLELLWVKDVGRAGAPQWYEAIPTAAIGRGLDHPWFDRAAFEAWWRTAGDTLPMLDRLREESDLVQRRALDAKRERLLQRREQGVLERSRRFGARQFDTRFLRAGAGFGDAARDRLLRLFRFQDLLNCLSIVSPLLVLRRFLPAADFAFSWGGRDGGARDDDDVRYGRVCFTRRVRDALLGRGLVVPEECRGVLVLDEPPPGVPVFDDPDHPPPPLLTPLEWVRVRAEEARLHARHESRRSGRPRGGGVE